MLHTTKELFCPVSKFLHVLKEIHYRYKSVQINQNSLNTNEMDSFGARALQTAVVLGDINSVNLESFGTGNVARADLCTWSLVWTQEQATR